MTWLSNGQAGAGAVATTTISTPNSSTDTNSSVENIINSSQNLLPSRDQETTPSVPSGSPLISKKSNGASSSASSSTSTTTSSCCSPPL
ncbi:hypothetical protein Ocin01_14989 [Orchesella cincta]|uniref:Uncharacterized protein n=1 Tax=Orchesella cincta TaxID=48709 RepID=A0A1D2MFF2_ORCCI|nr:hypothetical protein Ocin01_14989 [Orchesella cincta]